MNLKLAIQKSGRLHDDSMRLLKEAGIDIGAGVNKLKAEATNFPLELFFLRDDDIPQYVEDGVADIGFVGENVVYEKSKKVEVAYSLGFGKCRHIKKIFRRNCFPFHNRFTISFFPSMK